MDVLEFIAPEGVRAAWPLIRERVAALASRGGGAWLPEDVYAQLIAGEVFLWATEHCACFSVVRLDADPGRSLFVWLLSNQSETPLADFYEQLKEIARSHGCARGRFISSRRFDRALPGLTREFIYSFEA